jgi:nucleoid-associated protein YgaU
LAGAGYLVWQSSQPVETIVVMEEPEVEAAPATTPEAGTAVATAPEAEPVPDDAPVVPAIDTWRVASDGEALVAGIALPGSTVAVVVDDRTVAEGVALASGEFVLQFTLPPNPAPSLLWLSMSEAGGTPVASPEIVAIAPIAGPAVAVAEPEPTPAPEPTVETAPEPIAEETAAVAPDTAADPAAAATAPAALLVTDEGAVVLQEGAASDPAVTDQVVIDTIAYAPTGAVQLGGRGDAGATLRLYLDNADAAVVTVGDDGRWRVTLGDSAPGIYTLRVDQIDAAGKVTSRFETPFKRETREALAAAAGPAQPAAPEAEAAPGTETAAAETTEPTDTANVDPAPDSPAVPDAAEAPAAEIAAEEVASAEAAPAPVTITVQPGFTLWGIAQERLGNGVLYVQVFEANQEKIKDPDLIYPGQVFSIPESVAP